MKLFFARHGESEANILRVISNRGYQHGLTARGREQAHELVENLRGISLTAIYTSPLQRAVETAEILGKARGLSWQISDALREYDCGILEGRSDADAWAAHERSWRDWLDAAKRDSCPEGGESFHDIEARFVPFIQSLIEEYGDSDAAIALIGHGGTYRAMLPLVLNNIDADYAVAHPMKNAAFVRVIYKDNRLICTDWCGESMRSVNSQNET
jgi:probable phosphoglycerate mutase